MSDFASRTAGTPVAWRDCAEEERGRGKLIRSEIEKLKREVELADALALRFEDLAEMVAKHEGKQ